MPTFATITLFTGTRSQDCRPKQSLLSVKLPSNTSNSAPPGALTIASELACHDSSRTSSRRFLNSGVMELVP